MCDEAITPRFAPFRGIAATLAAIVILTHGILIFAGYWNSDEYFHFAHYRDLGLRYLGFRLLHDSPRPVSEIVLYLYRSVVESIKLPLIAPFLAVLWVTLIVTAIIAAWRTGFGDWLVRLTLGLSIVAMFLLGHGISEMFYWPMAAAAYLPSLAGMTLATLQIIDGRTATPRGRVICCGGLCLAALSVDSGMFAAFGFSVALALLAFSSLFRDRGDPGEREIVWWMIPLLISVGVLICVLRFRVGESVAEPGQPGTYFHHFWPAVSRTLAVLPSELAFGDAQGRGLPVKAAILAIKLLAFLGFCGLLNTASSKTPPVRHMAALIAGLSTSIVLTVLASFYQYGDWGTTRHRAWVQCILLLLLLVLARIATSRWRMPSKWAAATGPICLIAAMAIGMASRTGGLVHDYGMLPRIRAEQWLTWQSGMDPTTDSMRLVLPPAGRVLDTLQWRTGHFVISGDTSVTPWYIGGVLNYFNKKSVDIISDQP